MPKKRSVRRWIVDLGVFFLSAYCAISCNRSGTSPLARATSTPDIDSLYQNAERALNAGEYDEAISLFSETLLRDPQYYKAYVGRGLAYQYGPGDEVNAVLDITRAIHLDPEDADAYLARAFVYYESARYERVVDDCEEALRLRPQDARALNLLAWTLAYDLDRQYDSALDYALQAVELSPDVHTHDTLAWVYFKLEQFELALENFYVALSLNDRHAISLKGRGYVYLGLGDQEAALADFKAYLALDHDDPDRERVEQIVSDLQGP